MSTSESSTHASVFLIISIVWILVIGSAVAVVYSTHESRQLFHQLESLRREKNALQVEWGQLLLEKSTWSSQVRIERIAEKRLGMVSPDPKLVTMVKP